MVISLCSLVFGSILALSTFPFPILDDDDVHSFFCPVIRQMIVRENKKLDEDEKAIFEGADRARVQEAARLEGITFEQAMERRKGFR